MQEVLKSTNPVTISYACHLLDEHDIKYFLFDAAISALEGSIGAFPRRLMVIQQDLHMATRVLSEAELI
ncbi:MAG TPA: DUF2007 domain-containing protein [Rhizobiales bacterium]|nr:DUF2007 domain-containing protein [Hyphomicrobiales bacterium]